MAGKPRRHSRAKRVSLRHFAALGRASWVSFILLSLSPLALAQKPVPCRNEIIDGEVTAGQTFARPISNDLFLTLEPLASGWILRVLPRTGPRGQHDYAELATPPYRSVSPLLLSTDFSFRAQDALAWNPRHFHFAADRAAFLDLQHWYDEYEKGREGSPARRDAEVRLAALAAQTAEGELTLLDAHLVQGIANQAATAAMVATHLNSSAHELDQPSNGVVTQLGRLDWVRFRVRLALKPGLRAVPNAKIERGKCL